MEISKATFKSVKLQDIQKRMEAAQKSKKINFLIYGRSGTGKTLAAATAPPPVLLHSFDPGGWKSVQEEIDAGKVIFDDRFEQEEVDGKLCYDAWEAEFNALAKDGAFEELGTYVIDSGTFFLQALLDKVVHEAQYKPGSKRQKGDLIPELQDYNRQQTAALNILRNILNIPCNVIMTGHADIYVDESDGKVHGSLLATKGLQRKIPSLFDEMYLTQVKATSKGKEYQLLVNNDGKFEARTRIGRRAFDPIEKPNISNLIKKGS